MSKARDLGKEQFWRRALARWEQSGLSVGAFCIKERLTPCTFYWWRRELVRRKPAAVSFLPIHVVAEPGRSVDASGLEIALARGRRLLIQPGFDHDTLRQVLRVLEEPAC
jgi:hypothetical protein